VDRRLCSFRLSSDTQRCHAGKTNRELLELEDDINQQLDDGEAADPEYWTAVLRRLQIAKVCLTEARLLQRAVRQHRKLDGSCCSRACEVTSF